MDRSIVAGALAEIAQKLLETKALPESIPSKRPKIKLRRIDFENETVYEDRPANHNSLCSLIKLCTPLVDYYTSSGVKEESVISAIDVVRTFEVTSPATKQILENLRTESTSLRIRRSAQETLNCFAIKLVRTR